MDDPVLFNTFLTNVAGVNTPRVRNEIIGFAETFRALLASTEQELDTFVKTTHSSNSARANNAWILIPHSAVIILKSLLFELKDRERCDALPIAAMLQNLDQAQMLGLHLQ